ncbi:tetratricopeptide repeat protein [Candidatus Palauibacter sp.]|uniref:tetratricopeptide repeat protein n=1 Tax=Candidatus Palauibacter sp. TaxID=3101350 RepID=UPI003C70488F
MTVGALAVPTSAVAQVTAADSAAVLVATAGDFEARGELEVARALYEEVVRRYPDTPGAERARARLAGLAPATTPQDRRGDTEFRVWSTLYGLWLGVAVPSLADAHGSEPYGVGLLLGGPAGYLAGRAFSRSRSLSVGQARTITWAGTWGVWQGLGWAHALDLRARRGCDYCGPDENAVVATALAGGLAGILTGTLLSRGEVTEGTAASTYLGSLWGTWFGLAGAGVLDLDDTAVWTSTLLVGNAGLLAGALAGSKLDLSSRRAHMISLGGLIGGFGGIGIVLIAEPSSSSSGDFAIPLAASLVGLGLGALLTRDREGAPGEGSGAAPAASGLLAGALLTRSGNKLAVGLPMPFATTVRDPERSGRRHTAWNVPLLAVRF